LITTVSAVSRRSLWQIAVVFLLFPVLAASTTAQSATADPAEPPCQAPATTEKPPEPSPAQGKSQEKEENDKTGRSKLEKETGTVNDRIFEVLPNYGTVENGKSLPPLRVSQKFHLATAGVFDWGAFPFNGALAGIAQAENDPKEWGQGWGAYAKRYGASFADNSIGTYMTAAIYPSLLEEDPRYYRMGEGKFVHRAYHAVNRLFITRTDSGHERFNFSESLGNLTAAAISNAYHVPGDRTVSRNVTTFGFLILYDGISNELKEFWPDMRRKVLHKGDPQT